MIPMRSGSGEASGPFTSWRNRPVSSTRLVKRSRAAVVTLGARRHAAALAELPADQRPAPSVRDYDQLLAHHRAAIDQTGIDQTGIDQTGQERSS